MDNRTKTLNLIKRSPLYSTTGIQQSDITQKELHEIIERFLNKEWGDLNDHDVKQNESTLRSTCGPVLGSYRIRDHKVWIKAEVTEDHTYTTILFPHEY